MAKYRRIQKTIEAEQYFKGKTIEGVEMSEGWRPSGSHHDRFREDPEKPTPFVYTITGRVFLKEGDYIVTSKSGQRVITKEEFEKEYEIDN